MKVLYFNLALVFLLLAFSSYAQSDEVTQLKKDLVDANERAKFAEAQARRALEEAMRFQKEAEVSRVAAERAEAAAKRGRYICASKLMSIKSLELSADPQQEALVALLAYKLNRHYNGDPNDADVYKGLKTALTRFNDPLAKNQNVQMAAMATTLCSYVKREMTKDEWVNFMGSDLPYEKVCED